MNLANPWALLMALPLAIAAWRLLRRARRSGVRYSAIARLPAKSAGWRARLAAFTPYVILAGLAMMVLASARPRSPLSRQDKSVDSIAIAIAVDVSGSMLALDLTPKGQKFSLETTRLATAKKLFAEFVEKRPDDLIGLVTFGTYAATPSPLTADHDALLNVLKGVEIPLLNEEEQFTAIGDGLATALSRLKEARPKSKIVILLSDGENRTGAVEPDEAAKAAAAMGIKVYAIGVGTRSKRTPILVPAAFGRLVLEYTTNMAFDEHQLKSIASTTGGKYFPVNDRESLEEALEEIDKLETTRIETSAYERYAEHFPPLLLAGALLILVATSLSMLAVRRLA